MDVVVPSICLSSLAGALLFYAGGRVSPRAEQAAPPGPAPAAAFDAERAARAQAEEEAAAARRAHGEAAAALVEERGRSTALREDLAGERDARARADAEAAGDRRRLVDEGARLRAAAASLAEQLAALRARTADEDEVRTRVRVESAEARAAAAEIRVAELDAELQKARAELEKAAVAARRLAGEASALRARATTQGRAATELEAARVAVAAAEALAEARAADAARLQQENERLERAVAALEHDRAAAPDLAELQRKNVEAALRLRALEQRSAELDRREAEDATLRRRLDALAGAEVEAAHLRRQVRDLEARGFARRTTTLTGVEAAPSEPPPSAGAELSTSLELSLRRICEREAGCHTAVLADFRGLLIAAHGEPSHCEELAAAASVLTSTAERLRELLPLGEAASFTLVDENEVVFRTRLLAWEDERFLLGTLGAAPPGQDPVAAAMRARIAALIGAG